MRAVMMQHVKIISALFFIFWVLNALRKESEIKFGKVDKIPAAIKPDSGRIIVAIEYVDKIGHKIVLVTEYEKGKYGESGYRSELFAFEYLQEDQKWKQLWKIWDYAPNPLSSVSYDSSTINVVDIDNDSCGEVDFFYTISFDGADPWISKYMLHKGSKKFAIRGTLPMNVDDTARYERNIDNAFNTLPAIYKEYSSKRWDDFAKEHFKRILGLSKLPKR
jgi:hypothetical protein